VNLSVIYCFGDRGGTVVKVLGYKSEGRCIDPTWCHWNFLFVVLCVYCCFYFRCRTAG